MSEADEQCICSVPRTLREVNPKAYTPQLVSIGPLHNPCGSDEVDNTLKPMEELKLKYLKGLFNRGTQMQVHDLVLKLKEWENKIRSCYAEPIKYNSDEFLRMILIDACFIIEHFLSYFHYTEWKQKKDPILLNQHLLCQVSRDLILLENQLPFFVLEDIYMLTGIDQDHRFPSFLKITFRYFEGRYYVPIIDSEIVRPQHITDLLRIFYLPPSHHREISIANIEHIYSASQLSEAGLVFKVSTESKCLLDLEFHKSELKMPCLTLFDVTEAHFRNIVAFEQRYHLNSPYFTQYLYVLDSLIKSENDVNILVDRKIIVNAIGDANTVVTMVNNLCANVVVYFSPEYVSLCKRLNKFYENPFNKYKAIFHRDYFNTPWKKASTVAAIVLLLLTLIQTICSIISI